MSEYAKRIIVTGGSRGVGLALVRELLAQGYAVSTCSREISPELNALCEARREARLHWHPCTIGDDAKEASYFAAAVDWAGHVGLYGVVNNAGIAMDGILATFPNIESERIIAVNLLGALRISRLALRHMLGRPGEGRIINISSITASRGYTGLSAYSASKAGMDGLTRALAREVGRRQITVNSVAPGYLETEMSSRLEQRQRRQIINRTPLRRLGTVDDVTPVVRFLLSEEARFITGQTIIVDGGLTC